MQNYYQILEISRYSSQDDIKKAYLKMIKKYHPDVYSGDKVFAEKQTALITEAYTTLKNPELKAKYDHKIFGSESVKQTDESSEENVDESAEVEEETILESIRKFFKNLKDKIKAKSEKRKESKATVQEEKQKDSSVEHEENLYNGETKENDENFNPEQENLKDDANSQPKEEDNNPQPKVDETNKEHKKKMDASKRQRLILDLTIGAIVLLLLLLLIFPIK